MYANLDFFNVYKHPGWQVSFFSIQFCYQFLDADFTMYVYLSQKLFYSAYIRIKVSL